MKVQDVKQTGTCGNTVTANTRYGLVRRRRPVRSKRSTEAQIRPRDVLSRISARWRTFTETQFAAWNAAGRKATSRPWEGHSGPLSGFALYMKINCALAPAGVAIALTAIEMLTEAWRICDAGYKAVLDADIVGLTERQAAAIGEKAARDAGAEHIAFSVFCSGERTNTVVGRPSQKMIRTGDMIMYSLAVQYEGYIASDEWPFVAGGRPDREQAEFIRHLVKAEDLGTMSIRPGVVQGDVVRLIRDYFRDNGLEEYDLYPPIHGNGLAEAESPYPDENAKALFVPGIGFNFDVSLFGHPRVGSNRIEEGFIVTENGLLTLSKLVSSLREGL